MHNSPQSIQLPTINPATDGQKAADGLAPRHNKQSFGQGLCTHDSKQAP